jgi:hypothetical protein
MADAAAAQVALLSLSPAPTPAASSSSPATSSSLSIVQHAALTSTIGLCLGYAQHSARHKERLVRELALHPHATATATGGADPEREDPITLLHLLCMILGLSPNDSASASLAGTRRRFEYTAHMVNSQSDANVLRLPGVLESMLLELLHLCIPAAAQPDLRTSTQGSAPPARVADQMQYLRSLADRVTHLLAALPPSQTAAALLVPPEAGTEETLPPHQQCAQVATLMDLLSHWAWSVVRHARIAAHGGGVIMLY